MKKIDSLGLKLCSYQSRIFEESLDNTGCSSKIFIRRFMLSDLARRMDDIGFMFDASDIKNAYDELDEQYGKSNYGIEKFSKDELYWIGYIYRYWAYITGKTSRQVYKTIKPDKLRKVYYPYHSLDPQQAIERLMEEMDLKMNEEDDIARGVVILRKVRNRKAIKNKK